MPAGFRSRRQLVAEVWITFWLSLGTSGLYAALSLVKSLTASHAPLSHQLAVLESPVAPERSLLDLSYQLAGVLTALAPVGLVAYLLGRSGESLRTLGLDRRRPVSDWGWGAALAAGVGGIGLVLYLAAFHAGVALNVVPTTLPSAWWRLPVLVLQAFQNGLLEEVVVCGYLLHRLRQLGWRDDRALVVSSLVRGSYHLYQGLGGFVGNAAMGLLFGRIFQRRGRVAPLVIAHTLIDAFAFVGYVYLAGKVAWLPKP
ncbi:MAG: CPBP family intramembrane metalloprotease [Actinomycetota bacterium]|nr:CPBP family intramembrane metalloprotease [Actinomycetota bacterium]